MKEGFLGNRRLGMTALVFFPQPLWSENAAQSGRRKYPHDAAGEPVAGCFSDYLQTGGMRAELWVWSLLREEGRMWVFIRPRGGQDYYLLMCENRAGAKFCPIHRFDGKHQIPKFFRSLRRTGSVHRKEVNACYPMAIPGR